MLKKAKIFETGELDEKVVVAKIATEKNGMDFCFNHVTEIFLS